MRRMIPRSLFYHWVSVQKKIANKRFLLCLDFDGTLAPIANTPEKARLEKSMKKVLGKIAGNKHCRIAILSGRSLANVKEKVGIEGIIYSGNHGYEIQGPEFQYTKRIPETVRQAMRDIKRVLEDTLSEIYGVFVEDKGISLSVHYRRVGVWDVPKLKTMVGKAIRDYCIQGQIILRRGKKVLEVMPKIAWDKGCALGWIMKKERIGKTANRVVAYLGDDKTDEDAFKKVNTLGGLSILVGKSKLTHASYYVPDIKAVECFLEKVDQMTTEKCG